MVMKKSNLEKLISAAIDNMDVELGFTPSENGDLDVYWAMSPELGIKCSRCDEATALDHLKIEAEAYLISHLSKAKEIILKH